MSTYLYSSSSEHTFRIADDVLSEVVLSVLLSKFTFEMSDKEILWNVGSVWYPTVGRESNIPELPLKVGLYKS